MVEAVLSRLLPESGFDAEFEHGLNETAQVMRQHFTKGFVDLSRLGFTAEAVAKLSFDHAERRFDV